MTNAVSGKMNQIKSRAVMNYLSGRARWAILPAVYREKNFAQSQIINPLWLDIGLVRFL